MYKRQVPVPEYLLFVNYANLLTRTYERFLENQIRDKHPLTGLPIIFTIKSRRSEGGSSSQSAGARVASKGRNKSGGKGGTKAKPKTDEGAPSKSRPKKRFTSKGPGRKGPPSPKKGRRRG